MKKFIASLALALITTPAFAGVEFLNTSGTKLGVVNKVKCSTGITCTVGGGQITMVSSPTFGAGTVTITGDLSAQGAITGDGGDAISGYLQKQVAATATTITAAQCGSTFYNSGAVAINLPDGSAGLIGCRLTFVVANASNFDVNPGNSDQILTLTNAAGDSIRNATKGGSVTLQYGATNEWYVIGKEQGTWSDIN